LGRDPPALQEPLQSGIERAVVDEELLVGLLLEELRDSVSVVGAQCEAAENQDLERTLKEFEALR
jgi:hypothetical protein